MSPVVKRPELPSVIAGTAGHVDHGKTSLVRLLTGCETDKLKEEKERGMSINLGFAPCMLPGNRVVGIIDVPGHIDFIRNMIAGAASIDILILVIAADDGVMPQTVEHIQILKLLRKPKVIVALTKIDIVDSGMLELVKDEVIQFLQKSGFSNVPIIPVSNITFEGIDLIREKINEYAKDIESQNDSQMFRMNIERVFSVKGFGTVASGIPVSGKISEGDFVEILPSEKKTAIRAIQNYKYETGATMAHLCSALNLRDISHEDISRGMTICSPGYLKATYFAFAVMENISNTEIKHNCIFRFHSGTSEMNAKIRLIGSKKIYPFNNSIVELILENPIALVSGDRFILRSLSPSLTVAGGTILSCHKIKERGSKKEVLIERLNKSAKFAYENDFFVAELFACPNPLISKNELVRMTGLLGEDANKLISRKISIGILAEINDSLFVVLGRINELCDKIKKPLEKYHKDNPNSLGMEFNSMLKLVGLESANTAKLWKLLETLSADFKIVNNRIAMKNFRPTSSSRTLELKERIISILKDAGINCPAIGNIISALSISETEMKGLIKMLVEEKHAVVIGNHITSYAVYELCLLKVTELYKAKKNIEIADFRAETGAARNMAVAILEKFDSLGFTKRTPSGRIFIKKFEG